MSSLYFIPRRENSEQLADDHASPVTAAKQIQGIFSPHSTVTPNLSKLGGWERRGRGIKSSIFFLN